MNTLDKYKHISVEISSSILKTLKSMESLQRKLLIVTEDKQYKGLISIGDIQRAIIANIDIHSPISMVIRDNVRVATTDDDIEQVKAKMLITHNEFMPILAGDELVDVIFWEDLFKDRKKTVNQLDEKLPVVIMAGGTGSRLQPLTNVLPKPLIPIGEKTIIEDIMDRFVDVGCRDFHISVNYKAEMMKYYLDGLNNPAYDISYFQEDKPLGTAGSLSLLKDEITTPFFVSNCDIIIDEDYSKIYKYHKENKNEITLVGATQYLKMPYGIVVTKEEGILENIIEKPEYLYKINAGLYIIEPHLLNEIPRDTFFHITELIEKLGKEGRRVGVFPISETSWTDIGTWEEYRKYLV